MDRRSFLSACATPLLLPSPTAGKELTAEIARAQGSPQELAHDEDYWQLVQQAFEVDRSLINLNNGGVSPSPASVQRALARHNAFANEAPAYKMWHVLEPQKETIRSDLARHFGASAEEIAIVRNSSEGLETCQFGIDLKAGDEVLCSNQDYPRMLATFRQRERREGIHLRLLSLPTPLSDPSEAVRRYAAAITERTKLILVCHMINLTGQVLPVREIVALGRAHNIPVVVDGAHSFAHLPFVQSDLDCDYYATSLHKWLFAPFGCGLLYVRRSKIAGLWPLFGAEEKLGSDIRKYEQFGTHPVPIFLAIAEALRLHEAIGAERKLARLIALRERWLAPLRNEERVQLNTNLSPGWAGGIANVRIQGIDSTALQRWLWQERHIYTIPIVHHAPGGELEYEGLRISPSVYTTMAELDRFAEALLHVLAHGLPS